MRCTQPTAGCLIITYQDAIDAAVGLEGIKPGIRTSPTGVGLEACQKSLRPQRSSQKKAARVGQKVHYNIALTPRPL